MIEEKGKITVKHYDREISFEFDNNLTTREFVEDVIAPLLMAMGYFPTNVYDALCMDSHMQTIKETIRDGKYD